jgi:hypothetical protein
MARKPGDVGAVDCCYVVLVSVDTFDREGRWNGQGVIAPAAHAAVFDVDVTALRATNSVSANCEQVLPPHAENHHNATCRGQ